MGVLAVLLLPAPATASEPDELSARLDLLAAPKLRTAAPDRQARSVSLPTEGPGSLLRDGGELVVEIRVGGDAGERVAGIERAGAEVSAVSREYGLLDASIGEDDLRALGAAPGVRSITEVLTPTISASAGAGTRSINPCPTGTVSEGDSQLRAAAARTQFDVDGAGVKVGVLSDSFDRSAAGRTAAQDVAGNDLPGPGNGCGRTQAVQILDDLASSSSTMPSDEGRAMAQIVHDLAPGANLAFATAFTGQVGFAANIRSLAATGADVIVDDVSYLDEPYFQDGIVAGAVNDVTSDGVAYFSSAGNNNRIVAGNEVNSWEAPAYRPTSCPAPVAVAGADCMDFDPTAAGTDNTFNLTAATQPSAAPFRDFAFALQWAEPRGGVSTDLDLFVVNASTGQVLGVPEQNPTTQRPFEFVGFTPNNPAPANYQLIVRRTNSAAAGTPRLKWINMDNGAGSIAGSEYPTSADGDVVGPTIFGHNGAAGAQSVAAVRYTSTSALEPFSSRGPVSQYFAPVSGSAPAPALASPQVLPKPDVAATDGGLNSFFPAPCTVCRFFGTSAAAPHAAGVAALQLEANSALSAAGVKGTQRSTAVAVGAFGAPAAGGGLIDAQAAIAANPPPAPTVSPVVPRLTNDPTPAIALNAIGDIKTGSCSVDGGAAQPCSGSFVPAPLGDGGHTVNVTVADYFAQTGSAAARFTVDTRAPSLKIKRRPKKRSTKRKARFSFEVNRGAALECRLDKGRFKRCGPKARFRVKPGKHRLRVHATDEAGNVSKDVKYKWKVLKRKKRARR